MKEWRTSHLAQRQRVDLILMPISALVESAAEHPGKGGVRRGGNARASKPYSRVALALAADDKRRFHCQIGNCRSATLFHLARFVFSVAPRSDSARNEKAEL